MVLDGRASANEKSPSVLAYELPDGRLKLIDGQLRRDLDPDMELDVEVLDVDDAEARKLLLSLALTPWRR
jgi:hypothetical protein